MARKSDLVVMKVPEEFRILVDEKRLQEGYNNRERAQFLRDLCEKEDPFAELTGKYKKQESSMDRGFFDGF